MDSGGFFNPLRATKQLNNNLFQFIQIFQHEEATVSKATEPASSHRRTDICSECCFYSTQLKKLLNGPLPRFDRVLIFSGVINPLRVALNNL